MCKWNYLKFNRYGDPNRNCLMPEDGTMVWGFCGEDHRVLLCYKKPGDNLACITPHGLDEDAYIIAWASVAEVPTWPDFKQFKHCRTLMAPVGSLEWIKSKLTTLKRTYRESSRPKSKAETKRRLEEIKSFQERIDAIKQDFVMENGYHMPRVPTPGRGRIRFAIPVRHNGRTPK
ncbi:MAG: hypothetical protein WCV99_06925 [Sterolibacterium sp.]|jgi:hypothetical protein